MAERNHRLVQKVIRTILQDSSKQILLEGTMNIKLEQRMAQSYLDLFPQFIPDEEAEVSVSEQEEFYVLMKDLYELAYNEPQLFVPTLHDDDAYPNHFNKVSYGKPELLTIQKKYLKAVDSLLQNMFLLGQGETVKLNKRQKVILEHLGIKDVNELPSAWKWMATRPEADMESFSHCFFKKDYPYTSDIYASLLGAEEFYKLEKWMIERGYEPHVIKDSPATDCKIILTYANPVWSKEKPKGSFEYKIKHTGICVRYDPYFQEPCIMGICIPNGLKTYLEHFDDMEDALKNFVVTYTKKCDGCKYCVQTDKTGQRPLASIHVEHKEEKVLLCPYFPGFTYCWTRLDANLVDSIIEMLDFMDQFAKL